MKVILALVLLLSSRCLAQFAVIDIANLAQSVTNYAAMLQQIAKETEQITNQIQQIRHMEDQLLRLGKMADFRNLIGFPEFQLALTTPSQIRTWAETLLNVDGSGLFGDTRSGIFSPIAAGFSDFDGALVARAVDLYKPAHEVTNKVDNFKEVQADVYQRRQDLKEAIALTSAALQAASTVAEEQKLEAVLNAQYDQLAALDSEVTLSAAEIQVKMAEANAMDDAQSQAEAESRGTLAQQEGSKISTAFQPAYECLLQYVTERRFIP